MYAACKACVADGWSLVIFPQGTRGRHGPPLPFKKVSWLPFSQFIPHFYPLFYVFPSLSLSLCLAFALHIFGSTLQLTSRYYPPPKGAFNLAAELGLPVLPVSIHIPGDVWLNGTKITVQVGL
jgi:1-acyl-sn-glycerol-3-phosphate acyltransferase